MLFGNGLLSNIIVRLFAWIVVNINKNINPENIVNVLNDTKIQNVIPDDFR